MTYIEAADLFGKWAAKEGLLDRVTEDQCADFARAFIAGWFYGQNPVLRSDLRRAWVTVHKPGTSPEKRVSDIAEPFS